MWIGFLKNIWIVKGMVLDAILIVKQFWAKEFLISYRSVDHTKGIADYRYGLNTGTTTSSGYSSSTTSAYSGADPVTVYSRDRIGKISKTVFDTEDYHQANKNITPEELRMPRKGQDWVHIWKSATADPKNRAEKEDFSSHANAFRFNSPWK